MAKFPKDIRTGEWIRDYLIKKREDNVYGMYLKYKEYGEKKGYVPGSYDNFRRYIWFCKRLGLIRLSKIRKIPKSKGKMKRKAGGLEKHYYVLNLEEISNPAWKMPQAKLYPESHREARSK